MGGVTSGGIFDIYTTDFAVETVKVEERGDFTLFTPILPMFEMSYLGKYGEALLCAGQAL